MLPSAVLGVLTPGFAHELAQPLNALGARVETCLLHLRSGRSDPAVFLALLRQAGKDAERAGEVLRRMRDYAARRTPEQGALDLRDVLGRLHRLQGEARRDGVTLTIDAGARPLPVRGDVRQIDYVVGAVVRGALAAVASGRAKRRDVHVRATARERAAEVAVTHAGTDRRAMRDVATDAPICRAIVQAHDGTLVVVPESRTRSTTLRLVLPLRPAER